MSWQTKVYTKENLRTLTAEKTLAEQKQKIRTAIHELQNEVLYRARQGQTSASIVVARTKLIERPIYLVEIMDKIKDMFPDSSIHYSTSTGIIECEHIISISWS